MTTEINPPVHHSPEADAQQAPVAAATAAVLDLPTGLAQLLANSPAPLLHKDISSGLKKAGIKPRKKQTAVEFAAEVQQSIDEAVHAGKAFRYKSGKAGAERFWGKDEKHAIQEAAKTAAATPMALKALFTAAAKAVKGADKGFVEEIVRGLIGDDMLFEHPGKMVKFGAVKPPPPPAPIPKLEQPKFVKKLKTLNTSIAKLMAEANEGFEDVVLALRKQFVPAAVVTKEELPKHQETGSQAHAIPSATQPTAAPVSPASTATHADTSTLESMILNIVNRTGPGMVLSLANVRKEVPSQYQGRDFDDAVLKLADAEKVAIFQDGDPASLSDEQKASFVSDENGHVFKTIAKGD